MLCSQLFQSKVYIFRYIYRYFSLYIAVHSIFLFLLLILWCSSVYPLPSKWTGCGCVLRIHFTNIDRSNASKFFSNIHPMWWESAQFWFEQLSLTLLSSLTIVLYRYRLFFLHCSLFLFRVQARTFTRTYALPFAHLECYTVHFMWFLRWNWCAPHRHYNIFVMPLTSTVSHFYSVLNGKSIEMRLLCLNNVNITMSQFNDHHQCLRPHKELLEVVAELLLFLLVLNFLFHQSQCHTHNTLLFVLIIFPKKGIKEKSRLIHDIPMRSILNGINTLGHITVTLVDPSVMHIPNCSSYILHAIWMASRSSLIFNVLIWDIQLIISFWNLKHKSNTNDFKWKFNIPKNIYNG